MGSMRWFAVGAGLALLLVGCGRIPDTDPLGRTAGGSSPTTRSSPADPDGAEDCEYVPSGEAARSVALPPATGVPRSGTVSYVLETTEGDVTIILDRVRAPCTVNSFISLAEQGYFNNTRCHRLADSGIYLLQCGDPTGTGRGGPGYTFADEIDQTESYTAGVVAMANAGPNTNGSQFFMTWDDSTSLDDVEGRYTIFGRLDERSRGVVARIAAEGQDGSNPDGTGRPNNPAEIFAVAKAGPG